MHLSKETTLNLLFIYHFDSIYALIQVHALTYMTTV